MYSRRLNVEEKENKRKTMGFVLLTFAALLFMYFFGFPLLIKLSNFVYDLKGSDEPIIAVDQTPPPPPQINTLPEFTKEKTIEVIGNSEPGSKVSVFVDSRDYNVLANADGEFSQKIDLSDGENYIYVISIDSAGNKSSKSEEFNVVYDVTAPQVELLHPRNGEEFYGVNGKQLKIEGTSEKDVNIQINDRNAIVDNTGKFVLTSSLSEGDNRFVVKAQDLAGNLTETEFTVKYFR